MSNDSAGKEIQPIDTQEELSVYLVVCGTINGELNYKLVYAPRQSAAEYRMAEILKDKYADDLHPKVSLTDLQQECWSRKIHPRALLSVEEIIGYINRRQVNTYSVRGTSQDFIDKKLGGDEDGRSNTSSGKTPWQELSCEISAEYESKKDTQTPKGRQPSKVHAKK